MRLLNVGLVSAALLASTSMVMAQSTNTYRYHRHHMARNAAEPYGYQGSFGGTEGFHGAAHNGAAGVQITPPATNHDMQLLPGASAETNRWHEWAVSR